eukprot:SAG11_NODE_21235_length_429_cov_0.775758_2_plen_50_part_01
MIGRLVGPLLLQGHHSVSTSLTSLIARIELRNGVISVESWMETFHDSFHF